MANIRDEDMKALVEFGFTEQTANCLIRIANSMFGGGVQEQKPALPGYIVPRMNGTFPITLQNIVEHFGVNVLKPISMVDLVNRCPRFKREFGSNYDRFRLCDRNKVYIMAAIYDVWSNDTAMAYTAQQNYFKYAEESWRHLKTAGVLIICSDPNYNLLGSAQSHGYQDNLLFTCSEETVKELLRTTGTYMQFSPGFNLELFVHNVMAKCSNNNLRGINGNG